jgi:hypothetical protein
MKNPGYSNPTADVLPLPTLEYDVQYMNALVRLLNYFIQQQANPGPVLGTELTLTLTGSGAVQPVASIEHIIDPTSSLVNKTIVNIVNLPVSSTGLSSGDIWNDANTLKIIP